MQEIWYAVTPMKGNLPLQKILEATLGPISFDVEDQIGIFSGEDCVGFEKKNEQVHIHGTHGYRRE